MGRLMSWFGAISIAVAACGTPNSSPTDAAIEPDADIDAAESDAGVDSPSPQKVRVNGVCYEICVTDSDPDDDGWGYQNNASCVMPDNPLATSEPWCDTPLPQTPYEATPATVSASTTSVAVIPRPPKVTVPAPTSCPHADASLVAWDPAWIDGGGVASVPPGVRTLVRGNLDIPAATLITRLVIPATSEVVIDDRDATFRVTDVVVEGALRLGSPTCRLTHAIAFEFDTTEDLTDPNVLAAIHARAGLGIVVHPGGVFDVFGKLYQPTWTRLAATASAAATQVTLAEAVDWEIGQTLVVVTSDRRDYPFNDENEVRTITDVTGGGTVLTLDSPLAKTHYGGAEYQVEVALLSRNIVFRTAPAVLATAPTFGGHIMSHASDVRISGAELYGLGQQNFMGRYPFHLHAAGDVAWKASFTDNSMWRSNWRCAVLHRTDHALVSRNVAFDVWGHCYYLEDGVEMNNELSYNLAARIKIMGPVDATSLTAMRNAGQQGFTLLASATMVQPADRAAAGFYIPNGNNKVIGNTASGGFAGYSLPGFPTAIGGSAERILPIRYTASYFDGNTGHSAGYLWGNSGCVYSGGILRTVMDNGEEKLEYSSGRTTDWNLLRHTPDVFNNTKTFLCENGIVHWGSRPRAINLEAADNGLLAKLFGSASIDGAVVTAKTGNTPNLSARPIRWWSGGFQFYDTGTQTILRSVVFRELYADANPGAQNSWDNCALQSMNHSDQYTPQRMNATANIFYANVDDSRRICHDDSGTLASRNFNFIDSDGTASDFVGDNLTGGPRLVGSAFVDTWNIAPTCAKNTAWGVWVCPLTGTQSVASVGTIPNAGVQVTMYSLTNGLARGTTWYSANEYIEAQITAPSEVGWHHEFPGGVPDTFKVQTLQVPANSFALLSFTLPAGVACSINATGWTAVASLSALLASNTAAYTTDRNTCFVRIPPTNIGTFDASGLSIPYQTWRGNPTSTTYFTVTTGCTSTNTSCQTVVSTLPTIP